MRNEKATHSHTVVLIQYNAHANSRTYLDFETMSAALDGARHACPALAT